MSTSFRAARLGRRSFPRVSDYAHIGMLGGPIAAVGAALDDMLTDQVRRVREIEANEQAAALARSDLNARGFIGRAALDAGDDEQKFASVVGPAKSAWLENIPEDRRELASVRWDDLTQQHAFKITTQRLQNAEASANGDLVADTQPTLAELFDAARDQNPAAEKRACDRLTALNEARTDLSPVQKEQNLLAWRSKADGHVVMGAFDRELRRGGLSAGETFRARFMAGDVIEDPDLRAKYGSEMDQALTEQVRSIERIERANDKARKEQQDQTFALGVRGLGDGSLTRETVDGWLTNRKIGADHAASLYRSLNSPDAARDDPAAVVELYRAQDRGESTAQVALEMFSQGRISLSTLNREREREAQISGEPTRVKQYRSFVRDSVGGVRGPLAVLDADASAREAMAIREYDERVADREDPREVADDIGKRYRAQPLSPTAYPAPRFIGSGDRNSLQDLEQARQETAHALQAGRISPAEAAREGQLLQTLIGLAQQRQQGA